MAVMNGEEVAGGTSWGLIIFFLFLFFFFNGGLGFGRANAFAGQGGGCNGVSNCQVEMNNIQALNDLSNRITAENQASTQAIQSQLRLQYDAQQGEKMFDLKLNNLAMQQAYESKLMAKDSTIERMQLMEQMGSRFDMLQAQLNDLNCSVLKKPQVYGLGAVCPAQAIPYNSNCNMI